MEYLPKEPNYSHPQFYDQLPKDTSNKSKHIRLDSKDAKPVEAAAEYHLFLEVKIDVGKKFKIF